MNERKQQWNETNIIKINEILSINKYEIKVKGEPIAPFDLSIYLKYYVKSIILSYNS